MRTSLEYPILKKELMRSYKSKWDHSFLQEQVLKEQLARSSSFANCFNPKLNLTASLRGDIYNRTHGTIPLSLVIQIFGTQGDGKSKLAIEVAKKIDPTFNAKRLFMKIEPLLNSLKHAKSNNCFILDEQALIFGEGANRQLAELQNVEEITRIKQIHFIYCSPTLREHLASHYTFKVIQKNKAKRITKFAFCNNNGSYFYGWGQAFIPKDEDCQIYQEYEPIKLKYVEDVLNRSSQKYDIWERASKLLAHKDIKLCSNKTEVLVLCQDLWPSLTLGEHNKIVSAGRLLDRRRGMAK